MITDKKGDLVKLAFKEYEPLNIICNTLQIPQVYSSAQTLVILQKETNQETPFCVYVLNISETEVSKLPSYSEMAEVQKALTRNEMVARMLIPRRLPAQIKRPIEETPVENEVEEVRESIKQVSLDLMDDFKLMEDLAKVTSATIKTRLDLQT